MEVELTLNVHLGSNVTIVNINLENSVSPTFLSNIAGPTQQQNVSVHGATGTMDVSAPAAEAGASDSDATTVDGQEALSAPALSANAKTAFLAIMWVFVILLPLKIGLLPPEFQAIIRDYIALVPAAVVIHWHVTGNGKGD